MLTFHPQLSKANKCLESNKATNNLWLIPIIIPIKTPNLTCFGVWLCICFSGVHWCFFFPFLLIFFSVCFFLKTRSRAVLPFLSVPSCRHALLKSFRAILQVFLGLWRLVSQTEPDCSFRRMVAKQVV